MRGLAPAPRGYKPAFPASAADFPNCRSYYDSLAQLAANCLSLNFLLLSPSLADWDRLGAKIAQFQSYFSKVSSKTTKWILRCEDSLAHIYEEQVRALLRKPLRVDELHFNGIIHCARHPTH